MAGALTTKDVLISNCNPAPDGITDIFQNYLGILSISYQCIINWNELQNFNSPAFLTNLSYSQLRKKTLEFLSLQ